MARLREAVRARVSVPLALAALAVGGAGLVFSCGSPVEPDLGAAARRPVAIGLRATVRAKAADDLNIRVRSWYRRQDSTAVDLAEQVFPLADLQTQQVRIGVEIGPCLADNQRAPAGPDCTVFLEVLLRRGETVLDRQVVGPLATRVGSVFNVPSPVSLVEVARIDVPPTPPLNPGQQQQLSVTPRDDNGQVLDRPITWTSSNPNIATVNPSGVITAVAPGTTTISATAGGQTVQIQITVQAQPSLRLPTSAVSVSAARNQPTLPAVQVVQVENGGGGELAGLALGPIVFQPTVPAWLTAALSGATAPATLTLTTTRTDLAPGTYTAVVPVQATAGNSPQNVTVTYLVGAGPSLALGETSRALAIDQGGTPTAPAVTIVNAGGGGANALSGLQAAVTFDQGQPTGWLTAALSQATSPASLTLGFATATLPAGAYGATVTVSAANAENGPQQFRVTLAVSATAQLALAPSAVTRGTAQNLAAPEPVAIAVTNGGGGGATALTNLAVGTLTFSGDVAPWLTATLSGTTSPATLTLAVTRTDLAPGTYTATIPVSATGATNSPQALTYTLNVANGPVLAVPTVPGVAVQQGQSPAAVPVALTNGGGGAPDAVTGLVIGAVQFAPGQPTGWVSAALDRTSTPAVATLTFSSASLAPGTYTATIPVSSPVAVNGPQAITVSLTVTQAPLLQLAATAVPVAAVRGLATPPVVRVNVTNAGGGGEAALTGLQAGAVQFTPAVAPWLAATLDGATSPTQLALAVTRTDLEAGTYTATVPVSSPAAFNGPQSLTVTLTVTEGPTLAVDQPNVTRTALQGVAPAPATIALTNIGGGGPSILAGLATQVAYDQGQPAGWLSPSLSAPATPSSLALGFTTTGLQPGTYGATVTVTSPQAQNGPVTVRVTLTVTQGPIVALGTTVVARAAVRSLAAPAAVDVPVTNAGGGGDAALTGLAAGPVTFQPAVPVWLAATLSGATSPATLSLAVTRTDLAPGTYVALVPVTSPAAFNAEPAVVRYELTVGEGPLLQLSRAEVPLAALERQATGTETVQLANVGGGGADALASLQAQVTYDQGQPTGWLTSQLSGAVTPATLQLSAAAGELPAGSYGATVTLTSPAALNGPQAVRVTFAVGAGPRVTLTPADSARFTAVRLLALPAAQVVQVGNTGPVVTGLTATTAYDGPQNGWLTATLNQATTPATLTLQPSTTALPAGTYTARVTLQATNALNTPLVIPVRFSVGDAPAIAVAAPPAPITVVEGTTLAPVALAVTNAGGGGAAALTGLALTNVQVTPAAPAGALTLTLSAATSPTTLVVGGATQNLAAGTYTISGSLASPVAGNSPLAVAVPVTVTSGARLQLAPASVSFTGTPGLADPPAQQVAATALVPAVPVTGLTVQSVVYDQGQPSGWLTTATIAPGATPATLTLRPTTGALAAGAYGATVTVAGANALNQPQTVRVTFTVTPPPAIALDATTRSVTGDELAEVPPTLAPVAVTNGGGGGANALAGLAVGTIGFAPAVAPWLSASIAPGVSPASLAFTVTRTNLAAGTYTATVPVSSTTPGVAPQLVTVTYTVLAAGRLQLGVAEAAFAGAVNLPDPPAQAVVLTATGRTITGVAPTIAYDQAQTGWLSAVAPTSVTPGAPGQLQLAVTRGQLPAGVYTATVRVNGANSLTTPGVAVRFEVDPTPVLELDATARAASVAERAAAPVLAPVTVRNGGGGGDDALTGLAVGTIGYAPSVAPWLAASLGGGVSPAALALTVTNTNLPVGTYTAIVPVTTALPNVQGASVTVTLEVTAGPRLQVGATTAAFAGTVNLPDPPAQPIQLTATGQTVTAVAPTIAYDQPQTGWLTATAPSQVVPGGPGQLQLAVTRGALGPGTYTANVTLTSSSLDAAPVVAVTYVVAAAPVIAATPATQAVSGQELAAVAPALAAVAITNGGGGGPAALSGLAVGTITYSLGAEPWLTATLNQATTPATLTLAISRQNLAPGRTYQATVPVSSTTPGVAPQNVIVDYTVTEAPRLVVPATAAFSGTPGLPSPAPQDLAVTATGPAVTGLGVGTITYGPSQPTGWLAATINPTTTPATLRLTATTGALPQGTYTATVPVDGANDINGPRSVAVTFTVTAGPVIAATPATQAVSGQELAATAPALAAVAITNGGGGGPTALAGLAVGTITYDPNVAAWLTASLNQATSPATLTLGISRTDLAPGQTYRATVPVSSTTPGVVTQNVTVDYTVTQAPRLVVPATATFSGTANLPSPAAQDLAVTATGPAVTGLAVGTITYNQPQTGWLAATINPTTTPATLRLTPTTGTLPNGTYTATVPVDGTNDINGPQNVVVTFVVAASPSIALSATTRSEAMVELGAVASIPAVTVTNGTQGGDPAALTGLAVGPIVFSGGPQPLQTGWLQATLSQATSPAQLSFTVTRNTLPAGTYTATVPVTTTVPSVASRTVTVTLTVAGAPRLAVSQTALSFSGTRNLGDPPAQVVNVTSSGVPVTGLTRTITYAQGQPTGWLVASELLGATPATLTLQPEQGTLPAGTYNATITVDGNNEVNGPQEIAVTYVLAPSPAFALSAITRAANVVERGAPPAIASIDVTNGGGGGANALTGLQLGGVTFTPAVPAWLTAQLSPASTPATLGLTVTNTNLPAGTYNADVRLQTISVPNVRDTTVRVTLTVAAGPRLQAAAATATFNGQTNLPDPPAQPIQLTATGQTVTAVAPTIAYNQPETGWLTATAPAQVVPGVPGQLQLAVTRGALGPGTYTANVTLTSSSLDAAPVVAVTYVVAAAPVIAATPATQAVSGQELAATAPALAAVNITNGGGGGVNGLTGLSLGATVYAPNVAAWLTATLSQTTSPATLTLGISRTDLAPGVTYRATVPVSSTMPGVATQNVTVEYTVTTAPRLVVPATATFSGTANLPSPAAQDLAVTATGPAVTGLAVGTITYGATQPTGWLAAAINPTTTPATLRLTATTGALPAGTYTATVPVTGANAINNPQNVVVTFTVAASPAITLAPATRTVTSVENASPAPTIAAVAVTNGGGGGANALTGLAVGTITYNPQVTGWLSATLNQTTSPASLSLTVTRTNLTAGTYTATVPVTTGIPNVPAQAVTVTYTVTAGARLALSPTTQSATVQQRFNGPLQTITISNPGGLTATGITVGPVDFGEGQSGWLNVTNPLATSLAPSATTTFTVRVDAQLLPVGIHTATVPVQGTNVPAGTSLTYTANITPGARLGLDSATVTFAAVQGQASPAPKVVVASNIGGGAQNTLAGLTTAVFYRNPQPPVQWLATALSQTVGPANITVTPTTSGLPAGTYIADVEVRSTTALNGNPGESFTVTVNVANPPSIGLGATSATLTAAERVNPAAQSIAVTNGGGGGPLQGLAATIAYAQGQPTGWLTAALLDGQQLPTTLTPATLRLTAVAGTLVQGTYNATVTLTSTTVGVASRQVAVTYTVTPGLRVLAAPAAPAFNALQGGGNPARIPVAITNNGLPAPPAGVIGGMTVAVAYAQGQPTGWLTAALTQASTPATLNLDAVTGALAAGTYSATVTVTAASAGNSPFAIPVTFTVAPSRLLSVSAVTGSDATVDVTSSPAGISCRLTGTTPTGTCSQRVGVGASVTLTVTPVAAADGWQGWTSANCPTTERSACTLAVSTDQAVTLRTRRAQAGQKVWLGGTPAALTTWATAGNWAPSGAPAATDNVIIPAGAIQPPLVGTSTQVRNLTLEPAGRDVTIAPAQLLGVDGDLAIGAGRTVIAPSQDEATLRLTRNDLAAPVATTWRGRVTGRLEVQRQVQVNAGTVADNLADDVVLLTNNQTFDTRLVLANGAGLRVQNLSISDSYSYLEQQSGLLQVDQLLDATFVNENTAQFNGGTLELRGGLTVNDGGFSRVFLAAPGHVTRLFARGQTINWNAQGMGEGDIVNGFGTLELVPDQAQPILLSTNSNVPFAHQFVASGGVELRSTDPQVQRYLRVGSTTMVTVPGRVAINTATFRGVTLELGMKNDGEVEALNRITFAGHRATGTTPLVVNMANSSLYATLTEPSFESLLGAPVGVTYLDVSCFNSCANPTLIVRDATVGGAAPTDEVFSRTRTSGDATVQWSPTPQPAPRIQLSRTLVGGLTSATNTLPAAIGVQVTNQNVNAPAALTGLVASANVPWLTATLNQATSPATLSLLPNANQNALTPGNYDATVTITSPVAANSPQTVTYSLRRVGTVTINVSPVGFAFSKVQGQANPPSLVANLTSSLGPVDDAVRNITTSITYAQGQPTGWLTATLAAGRDSTPVSVTLAAAEGTLPAGTYNATLTVSSRTTAPVQVPVTFTITGLQPVSIVVEPGSDGNLSVFNNTLAINCTVVAGVAQGVCSASFTPGTQINMTAAVPSLNQATNGFLGWTDATCAASRRAMCVFTMPNQPTVLRVRTRALPGGSTIMWVGNSAGADIGRYDLANNWVPARLPTSSDDVFVPNAAAAGAWNAATMPIRSLNVESGGTVAVTGGQLQVSGNLVANGGLQSNAPGFIRLTGAVPATATVSGTIGGFMSIGRATQLGAATAIGALNIESSGSLTTASFNLAVTDSLNAESGTLTIPGGTTTVGGILRMRPTPTNSGLVSLSGGSVLEARGNVLLGVITPLSVQVGFQASGNSVLRLAGTAGQQVSWNSSSSYNRIGDLQITNTSTAGVTLLQDLFIDGALTIENAAQARIQSTQAIGSARGLIVNGTSGRAIRLNRVRLDRVRLEGSNLAGAAVQLLDNLTFVGHRVTGTGYAPLALFVTSGTMTRAMASPVYETILDTDGATSRYALLSCTASCTGAELSTTTLTPNNQTWQRLQNRTLVTSTTTGQARVVFQPPTAPSMLLSTTNVNNLQTFSLTGRADTAAVSITSSAGHITGLRVVSTSVSTPGQWLSASINQTDTPATLTIVANMNVVNAPVCNFNPVIGNGIYTGTVVVEGQSRPRQTVNVTVTYFCQIGLNTPRAPQGIGEDDGRRAPAEAVTVASLAAPPSGGRVGRGEDEADEGAGSAG